MATITVSGQAQGNTYSATFTYTVTTVEASTTISITKCEWSRTGLSYGMRSRLTISGGPNLTVSIQYTSTNLSGTVTPSNPPTRVVNRITSSQSVTLTAEVLTLTPTSSPTESLVAKNTVSVTVPVLSSYSVSYNANGHGTAPASQTKYYGINLTLASAITATGYSFVRWNTNAFNTGTGYNAGASYTANSAATLYAIWNRTITYNANGGSSAPAAQTGLATDAITITPSVPTRSGYRFKNWNTAANGTGTSYSSGGSYASGSASITLYAQWEKAISSVSIGSAAAIRVESSDSTIEADEGTFAYISVPYTVNGAASANIEMSVTATADTGDDPTVTLVSWQATKAADAAQNGTFIARASGCAIDSKYSFSITITANNTTATQTAVTATRVVILPTAYFLVDFKAGGHGVHFGGAATEDGFFVSMPATFNVSGHVLMKNGTVNTDTMFRAHRTDTDVSVGFGVGSGGVNHGVYSNKLGRWLLYSDGTNVYVNNLNFTSADTARSALNAVSKAGDTMTGALTITGGGRRLYVNNTSAATETYIETANSKGRAVLDVYSDGKRGLWVSGANWVIYAVAGQNYCQADNMYKITSVHRAISYINGAKGDAALYCPKTYNVDAWYPAICLETKGGGSWQIGNYNSEYLNFAYATKANRDSSTNTVNVVQLPNVNGTLCFTGHSHGAGDITSGTLPIARGGTGTTTGCKQWVTIATVQGTASTTFTSWATSGYTDIMLMIWYGTSYLGTAIFPAFSITTTAYEVYTGGGRSGTGTGQRKACAKVSNTTLQGVQCAVDANDYTSSAYFRLYGR